MTDAASRYLALLGELDPIEVLSATPGHIEAWLETLNPTELDDPELLPAAAFSYPNDDARPSARELLAHVADFELATGFRLRQLVALPGIELQTIDHASWSGRYQRLDPSLALEAFRALRAWNLALLSGFSLEDWLAEGFHPERGFESTDVLVRQVAGHDLDVLLRLGIHARAEGSPPLP